MQVRIEGAVGGKKHSMLALGWVIEGDFFVLPSDVEISQQMKVTSMRKFVCACACVCVCVHVFMYTREGFNSCVLESAPSRAHEGEREVEKQKYRKRVCVKERTRLSMAERK